MGATGTMAGDGPGERGPNHRRAETGEPSRGFSGFTILELLLVIAMIGILATITVPAYLSTLHAAKQARTVADLQAAGAAWLSWRIDNHGTPAAGWSAGAPLLSTSHGAVADALVPTYAREVPRVDAWGHALAWSTGGPSKLAICSPGRDGLLGGCPGDRLAVHPPAGDYAADIVWTPGGILYRPSLAVDDASGIFLPPPENPHLGE